MLLMREDTFKSYDVHLFFFFSDGEKQAMAAAVPCERVCHEPAGQRHSEGHYFTGRLALAMALRNGHKGFSVRHLTQQEHSYVCRGFPWKPCKL